MCVCVCIRTSGEQVVSVDGEAPLTWLAVPVYRPVAAKHADEVSAETHLAEPALVQRVADRALRDNNNTHVSAHT